MIFTAGVVLLVFMDHATGYYLQQIGGSGTPRQVNVARYFCPLNTLDACQTVDVVLSSDAMKPCYSGNESVTKAVVAPGDTLSMKWLNVNDSSAVDYGVTVSMAPFALDPALNAFACIGSCAVSMTGGSGNVTVPANATDGTYTLLWLWRYGSNWYSSCADIQVKSVVNMSSYQTLGCYGLGYGFCQATFGPLSYCKTWTKDNCGRSYCKDGDLPYSPDCSGLATVTTTTTTQPKTTTTTATTQTKSTTTTPAATTTTTTPPSNNTLAYYSTNGCGKMNPSFCATSFGANSYCKTWSLDSCGRAVCQGTSELVRLNFC